MCQRRGSVVWLLVALAGGWFAPATLTAIPPAGEIFVLPKTPRPGGPPTPVTNGLTVTIDVTAYTGIGYCPIKVTVNAATPSPGDRSFSVQIGVPGSTRSTIEVSTNLDLAAGTSSTSTVLYVPHFVDKKSIRFDFWEDADHLADLSSDLDLNDGSLKLLVVCPNSEGFQGVNRLSYWYSTMLVDRNPNGVSYSPCDLPESVIGYSSFSAVLISIDELKDVIAGRAKAWKALRQWVASGGTLWVYGVTHDFKRLPELENLLDLPAAPMLDANESDRADQTDQPGWRKCRVFNEEFLEERVPNYKRSNSDFSYVIDPVEKARLEKEQQDYFEQLEKERSALRSRLKEPLFVVRPLRMGYVAALHTSDPMNEHRTFWELLSAEVHNRDHWIGRHRISFEGENPAFWNFMIPGVGLPPIVAFEVLITLFVIGIGPVNYLLLRRRHKQSWLIFTVPVSAALVTGCLLLYAVLADGLGIRARSRSFTEIDQRRGEAACWSRIAYYAGLQPSRGFEFALDTQVYPIEMFENRNEDSEPTKYVRKIEQGTTRRFTKGWLPARTVTQFLTVRARATSARLEIAPATDGSPPQVINRLGTRIEKLLVVAADGKCSWAEGIADGATAPTDNILPADGVQKLRGVFVANSLDFPPSWQDQRMNNGLFNIGRRNRGYARNPYSSPYSSSSGDSPGALLEEGLLRTAHDERPTPRSYIAIVERSPEFELGLDHVDSETGYHVIVGHW